MKKKRIVENDKAKILQTIKELDQKKNEALSVAWQKVWPPLAPHTFAIVAHFHLSLGYLQRSTDLLNLSYLSNVYLSLPQVNKDFGSIFSTLLPGATAKLAPAQGCGALEGLEFKVALGNTWKENLTELSGGQRSGKKALLWTMNEAGQCLLLF